MPEPTGFTPTEHLKDTLKKTYNKFVKEAFKDLDESSLDDMTLARTNLRKACLVDDRDSQICINNRMMLFFFTLRKGRDLQAPIFGEPIHEWQQKKTFKPQIQLYFEEPRDEVDPDFQPLRTIISYRLMSEKNTTISKIELRDKALKIKAIFGKPTPYKWRRGRVVSSYWDNQRGYQFKIFGSNIAQNKEVITKVLDIEDVSPDWKLLSTSENEEPSLAYPTLPDTAVILGKATRLPRKRAVGNVVFRRATCAIYGLPKPVPLYSLDDLSGSDSLIPV